MDTIVYTPGHQFFYNEVEVERWRLVEGRLNVALMNMLHHIPADHATLTIKLTSMKNKVQMNQNQQVTGRQIIKTMMNHFVTISSLATKVSYVALSTIKWKGDKLQQIVDFYYDFPSAILIYALYFSTGIS